MTDASERVPRKKGEKTRREILAAARKLFMELGYDNVGIRSIAGEAGVNIALINRYFNSKKELFAGVLEEFGGQFRTLGNMSDLQTQWQTIISLLIEGGPNKDITLNEFKLILLSALSPEVSDIVKTYLKEKRNRLATSLQFQDAKGMASLIFSISMGTALIFSLLELNDDTEGVMKQIKSIMDIIFNNENHKNHGF